MKLTLYNAIGILILITIFLLSVSCKKEHLPEYYFKCKVDGKEFVPDNCANCLTKTLYGDTLILLGASEGNSSIGLAIMKDKMKVGNYNLSIEIIEDEGTGSYDNIIGSPSNIFRTDSIRTGQLLLKVFDKSNKIIEGTFYFTAYNPIQNKTVKITDGKFRLQYNTY